MIRIKKSKSQDKRFVLDIGQYIFHISKKELKQIHKDTKKLLARIK